MRSWLGAVAVAAVVLVAPGVAVAGPDDPAQIQFKLPSRDAIEDFQSLGLSMDHGIRNAPGGGVLVSAWVTDEELAFVRARGFEPVATIADKNQIDLIRAEREETLAELKAAERALSVNAAGRRGASAAAGVVRLQRAEYYSNNVGRFLSIEAAAPSIVTCAPGCTSPTIVAEWYDAAGNRMGGGNLVISVDPQLNPDYYQFHTQIFRIGNKGDGGAMPASVKVAAPNGDVDTLATREWIAENPPPPGPGVLKGFVTHYNDSQEAYKKMRDLATEFPNISEAIKLPEQTRGYQRKAQTMLGYTNLPTTQNPNPAAPNPTTPYVRFDANNLPVAGNSPTAAQQPSTVVLTSKTYGHLGGNTLNAQIVNPAGAANQALSISVAGNEIRINPATDAAGAITSTAAQVVAALNADPAVSNLVIASLWRTSTGAGAVASGPASPLSDLLRAPATFPRGPQDQWMLRIGKQRDGSKVGVFLYCQEHGNEIATSGVCLETAERLVRNYGTDPETTALIDGLDIFIVPQINGDGATHSLYDSNRRTNLSNHCEDTVKFPANDTDPANRNGWGVDLNRNFSQGSVFDGYFGATATDCTNGNFAGIFEFSEPETRNESWVQTNFRNIKFVNNIHSSGGFFMWPPGAYIQAGRVPLAYPPYGTLNFFDQTGKEVLDRIKSHRGTAVIPQQTGPVIDVLYSAAGNSADEAYYSNGIIGFDFEIGATHYNDTGSGPATCDPGQQPPFGTSTNPCLVNEGFHEAMEFASGNYGLLREALDFANDTTAPNAQAVSTPENGALVNSYEVRFTTDEAASIHYTTDGSTPTAASPEYKPSRARALPDSLVLPAGTTLKWIAYDFKGNTSAVKSQQFIPHVTAPGTVTGTVPATLSLTLGPPATFGAFAPGVTRTYLTTLGATVTSTAGDATLSVADPSSIGTGHLVNGTFVLPQPLQARVSPGAFNNVGSSASPLNLRSWSAPTSSEAVTVDLSQQVNNTDPLRTGTYSKTLTFTLSTTSP